MTQMGLEASQSWRVNIFPVVLSTYKSRTPSVTLTNQRLIFAFPSMHPGVCGGRTMVAMVLAPNLYVPDSQATWGLVCFNLSILTDPPHWPPKHGTMLDMPSSTYSHSEVDRVWGAKGTYLGSFKDHILFTPAWL